MRSSTCSTGSNQPWMSMHKPVNTKKTTWTRVAFGDVVKLSKTRSRNPAREGYERVVGLEHMDPNDLRIRRWGRVTDGTTFSSVFRPGQVLFGKRRAYQRKVAMADFTGICSGDIYVLEPSNHALMPELLPFICETDAFFEHAVATSAGSLSPRTNWESLADFEFALPSIQEQARLVDALKASENISKHCHRSRGGEVVRGGRDWAWGGGSRKRREGVARPEFPADDGVVISPRGPFSGRGCD